MSVDERGRIIRCKGCGALNNYGGHREGKVARCGHCRAGLDVSGRAQGVREEELARAVEGAPVPVVALVWDPADPTCRAAAAALERISARHLGELLALTVDVEVHPGFPRAHGIASLPAFLLFRGGAERAPHEERREGVLDERDLERWLLSGAAPAASP